MAEDSLKQLEWFIDFIYRRLDSTHASELHDICAFLEQSFGHSSEEDLLGLEGLASWGATGRLPTIEAPMVALVNRTRQLQADLHEFFNDLMLQVEDLRESYQQVEGTYSRSMESISKTLQTIGTSVRLEVQIDIQAELLHEDPETGEQGMTWFFPAGRFNESPFKVTPIVPKDRDGIIYLFLRALNGVGIENFSRCKECGLWFVRTSKRERLFCSRNCAMAYGNRRRYKRLKEDGGEDYEEELEKGRERAFNSYVKKSRRTTGHKNLKLTRKPRKGKKKKEE